jgi:hypothetical protein
MIQRWWPLPGDPVLEEVVRKFSREPNAAEFTAMHLIVAEVTIEKRFPLREQGPNKLPLSESLLRGNTLRSLADAFRLPLADFIAVNGGHNWGPDTELPDQTWVNVPDPEFAPLVAARLAAEVVAADWLFPEEKRGLIQLLVPPAIHDRTSLDTILSRLVLAAGLDDQDLLARLMPLARQVYAQFPDVAGPTGHVEVYVQQKVDKIGGTLLGVSIDRRD